MSAPTPPVPRPVALPLCDRCGARCSFEVVTGSGPLYFCGHHFSKAARTFAFEAAGYEVNNLLLVT